MLTPVKVSGVEGYGYLEDIIDIRAGGDFTIALKKDGTAYTWGKNDEGQMGNGTAIYLYIHRHIKELIYMLPALVGMMAMI